LFDVVVSEQGKQYKDVVIVPLTSKIGNFKKGEFVISSWKKAALNIVTAVMQPRRLRDERSIENL
jgi:hypothetical protein